MTKEEDDEQKNLDYIEDMLFYGPLEEGQDVVYIGTLHQDLQGSVGVVKEVLDDASFARVNMQGIVISVWVGNLRRCHVDENGRWWRRDALLLR